MPRPMNRNRLPVRHSIDVLMSVGALPRRVRGAVLVAALLGGCGGGNDGSENPAAGNGTGLVATAIRQTAPASACPNGGVSVDAGIDKNANGVLDATEVTTTQYVCHSTGTNGNNVMVATAPEPVGSNCPNGGSKVSAGLDSNGDGALDTAEVTSTRYVCNTSGSWTSVSTGPVQTLPNQGYTALAVTMPLVLTLPANPAVDDTLHVVGAGAAGWQLAQNAGQSIVTSSLGAQAVTLASIGALWEERAVSVNSVTPGSIAKRIAASADGQRVAAVQGDSIRRSLDGGLTWVNGPVLPGGTLTTVAASADGLRLVTMNSSGVSTSADGGATWTARGGPAVSYWRAVASSADGTRLVAADSTPAPATTSGFLYTSSDAGVTWTQRGTAREWSDVASSADGMRLVAASPQGLYTSSDAGVTWTAREITQNWQGVASSADGAKLVATVYGGQIHTSTDAGVTWVTRNAGSSTLEPWGPVASSADGNRLVAATNLSGGTGIRGVFLSTDSGATWTLTPALSRAYTTLASSADGSRHVATAGTSLWTSAAQAHAPATTTGTGGALSGGQYSAVDLQYIGNGQWIILDHQGILFVK